MNSEWIENKSSVFHGDQRNITKSYMGRSHQWARKQHNKVEDCCHQLPSGASYFS